MRRCSWCGDPCGICDEAEGRGGYWALACVGQAVYFGEMFLRQMAFMTATMALMVEPLASEREIAQRMKELSRCGHAITALMLSLL